MEPHFTDTNDYYWPKGGIGAMSGVQLAGGGVRGR